jgi:hypothetical protein
VLERLVDIVCYYIFIYMQIYPSNK